MITDPQDHPLLRLITFKARIEARIGALLQKYSNQNYQAHQVTLVVKCCIGEYHLIENELICMERDSAFALRAS